MIDTYDTLKASVRDHLDRSDLDSQIEDFISLAESRHKREVRIQEMMTRENITVSQQAIDLPARYIEPVVFSLLTSPVTVLEAVSIHELNRRRRTGTGKPAYFTVLEKIEFDVAPDSPYTGELVFYRALKPLSATNPKNALLTRAPDVYLYSALSASAPFLLNDERIAMWESLYASGRDGVNETARRSRRFGPLISRVAGPTP